MDYASKVKATRDAQLSVQAALSEIPGVDYVYHPAKRNGVISIFNAGTNEYDKEAILNIFWDNDADEPGYVLISYPHSDVPFKTKKEKLDTNRDGTIQIQEIISIAKRLYRLLNT